MIRAIIFFIIAAFCIWLAIVFADSGGPVRLEWLGWRVDTSVGVLAVAVILMVVIAAALYRFWRFLRGAPGMFGERRQSRRRRQGYQFLTRGMVAVAAGDAGEAARMAKKADTLLQDPPLTMLLSAQAAQLDGDEDAARRYFEDMLEDPDVAFLGVRGLLMQAVKAGDTAQALSYAQKAIALKPDSPWVSEQLFEQQIAQSAWADADQTVDNARRRKVISKAEAARKQAVLAVELSRAASQSGKSALALKQAQRAVDLDAGFVPAVAVLSQQLLAAGKKRRAIRLLEKTWQQTPHPELIPAYLEIEPDEPATARVKRVQRLLELCPNSSDAQFAVAQACLTAQLWGEARRHADAAGQGNPSARVCRLMAKIEEAEHQDAAAASRWLNQAAQAEADEAWICNECGAIHSDWRAVCAQCGTFDALNWQVPANIVHLTSESIVEDEQKSQGEAPAALTHRS